MTKHVEGETHPVRRSAGEGRRGVARAGDESIRLVDESTDSGVIGVDDFTATAVPSLRPERLRRSSKRTGRAGFPPLNPTRPCRRQAPSAGLTRGPDIPLSGTGSCGPVHRPVHWMTLAHELGARGAQLVGP